MPLCARPCLFPTLLLLVTLTARPQTPPAPSLQTAQQAQAGSVPSRFAGVWVGQLESRDEQTGMSSYQPTWLTITPSADGRAMTLASLIDDGSGKLVRDEQTLTFDTTVNTATLQTGSETDLLEVHGLGAFARLGRGTLTFTGTGNLNGKPAYVRILITLDRNLYTWRREARAQDGTGVFRFHDACTFTRERPLIP